MSRTKAVHPATGALDTSMLAHDLVSIQHKCACGQTKSPFANSCRKCGSYFVQRKLAVGASNNPLEIEADRVADRVPENSAPGAVSVATPRLQQDVADADTYPAPISVERALAGAGVALPAGLRLDMEQRFGRDFSNVRIHTGVDAAQSARDLDAHAYTVGRHVVFGDNRFAPDTRIGRRLLVHELAHVVQQAGSSRVTVRRQTDPGVHGGSGETAVKAPAFAPPLAKRRDTRFARQQASVDATWLKSRDTFAADERSAVNARLGFFEGEAKQTYVRNIKPVLKLMARTPIEMPLAYVGDLSKVDPDRRGFVRKRREHTYRWFSKIKDHRLEDAYVSRLQRYLDEGMEDNKYWDLEMIEQIIAERAPDAPWHDAARQDFLNKRAQKQRSLAREKSLPTLSSYWQNQFAALEEQIATWKGDMKPYAQYARSLLWKWREQVAPYDDNPYIRDMIEPHVAEDLIFKDIAAQYNATLHERDRAIQAECRNHPEGRLMKFWGDPCKSWFGSESTRGEDEMRHLHMRMSIMRDKNRVPYRDITFLLKELKNCVAALPTSMAGRRLEILQTVATVQGAFALGVQPGKPGALSRPGTPAISTVGETTRALGVAAEAEGAARAAVPPRVGAQPPPVAQAAVEAPRPSAVAPKGAVAESPLAPTPGTAGTAASAAQAPVRPASIPPPPGIFKRTLQAVYLSLGMTLDELIPEHRNIAGGSIGQRTAPPLIEKAATPVRTTPTAEVRAPAPTSTPATQAAAPVTAAAAEARTPAPASTVSQSHAATPTTQTPAPPVAPTVAPAVGPTVATAHTVATTTTTPASGTSAASSAAAPGTTTAPAAATVVAATDPNAIQVYVNLDSRVFHLPGSRWYRIGVRNGAYMTRADAEARGYQQAGTPQAAPPSGVYSVERQDEGIVIRAWIGQRAARAGFERELPSAAEYALATIADWERAHSTGAGLRIESEAAIRLASRLVNQIFQNRGIEAFLRQLRDAGDPQSRLHLTTVTSTHPHTLRLQSIHYVVEHLDEGRLVTAFEVVIEMRRDGAARAGVRLSGNKYVFGPWFTR